MRNQLVHQCPVTRLGHKIHGESQSFLLPLLITADQQRKCLDKSENQRDDLLMESRSDQLNLPVLLGHSSEFAPVQDVPLGLEVFRQMRKMSLGCWVFAFSTQICLQGPGIRSDLATALGQIKSFLIAMGQHQELDGRIVLAQIGEIAEGINE